MDVRSRHGANPRSTRFVLGKASEYGRRPRRYDLDTLFRRREVAHDVLCSSPKPEQTLFFASERREIAIFGRLFSTHQPTTHLRSRYRINPRSTRFVSVKASEYRWRPSKFHVNPRSRGREVARDVLRSLPKHEKCLFFCHRRWIEISCHQISTKQRSNVFFTDAWQAPAIYHQPSCELCDPKVGRSH